MKVIIKQLSVEAHDRLIGLYGNQIFHWARENENGTYDATLDKYAIIKTGINEVKVDLGARCYYLSCFDFQTIEVM